MDYLDSCCKISSQLNFRHTLVKIHTLYYRASQIVNSSYKNRHYFFYSMYFYTHKKSYPISDLDDFKIIICRTLKHGAVQGIGADWRGLLRPGLQGHRAGLRSHRGAETYSQGNYNKLPSIGVKTSS